MKIYHVSDTHGYHYLLNIPKDIDMIIHSGDASNSRDMYKNEPEFREFLHWFKQLPIKYKIFVAGNHDTSVEKNLFDIKAQMKEMDIIYLENSEVIIEGIKIWGSPHTPTFGNWAFMKARNKIERVWKEIPDDTDIIVVHGPPKGIMDLSHKYDNSIERCGCGALLKRVLQIKPKLFLSGHIHNNKDIINAGVLKLSECDTIFSNGSVVTDGKFGTLSSNGNILEI
jgi:Icc-related predicted phosphoesterase